MKNVVKCLLALSLAVSVTACKLAIITPTGGDVTSQSNLRNCSQGKYCEFTITDTEFSEVFTATAKPGYEFVRWNNGDGFWCADSTSPTCEIPMPDDRTYAELVIAVYATSFAMPIFRDIGFDTDGDGLRNELDEDDDNDGLLDVDDTCQLNPDQACGGDIVFDNGKEWLQPDLFTGFSWSEIASACPGGVCQGFLNGYNLNGWIWADSETVRSLFASHGSATGNYYDCPLIDSFFNVGWRKTNSSWYQVHFDLVGWVSESVYHGLIVNDELFQCGYYVERVSLGTGDPIGAWFYRAP